MTSVADHVELLRMTLLAQREVDEAIGEQMA